MESFDECPVRYNAYWAVPTLPDMPLAAPSHQVRDLPTWAMFT